MPPRSHPLSGSALGPSVNTGALFVGSVSPSVTETSTNGDNDRDFAHETGSTIIGSNDHHLIVGLGFKVQCCLGLQLAAESSASMPNESAWVPPSV